MDTVNINRNVSDIFYRYKMPRLRIKSEGRGNGIKTVIVNMAEVARALGRPPSYPTKYFGCELGAQTYFDFKNERFIVNGAHDANKLQNLLDSFISRFVLCPECENPETDLSVNSRCSSIVQKCRVCGFNGPIKPSNKLNTFILKNPPTLSPNSHGASLTEGKRSKRSQRKSSDSDNSFQSMSLKKPSDSESSGSSETINGKQIKVFLENDESNVEWSVDTSREAINARLRNLTDGAKFLIVSEDCDRSIKKRIDMFYEMVKEKRDNHQLDSIDVQKQLRNDAARLDIENFATLVLIELLFTENIIEEAPKYRNFLLRFTHNNYKAQHYLIDGLEQIIFLHRSKLLPKSAGIFKHFYDNDILEEPVILDWARKNSKKKIPKEFSEKIHAKVQPFIKWLQEAEEEESTDTENNEFSNGASSAAIMLKNSFDSDAEEIDIDSI